MRPGELVMLRYSTFLRLAKYLNAPVPGAYYSSTQLMASGIFGIYISNAANLSYHNMECDWMHVLFEGNIYEVPANAVSIVRYEK